VAFEILPRKTAAAPDFFLLAHSHGVSLLDGATDWRARLRGGSGSDPRYGAAFAGWFHGGIPRTPFEVDMPGGSVAKRIVAWVISSSAGIGPLLAQCEAGAADTDIRLNSEYQRVLGLWHGAAPIVSMIHGNEHWPTLLNMWPPCDFVEETTPGIAPGVPVIDEAFIDAQLAPWVAAAFFPLWAIRRMVPNPLAHCLPPPPRENPQGSLHLEVLQEHVARYGFAPDRQRLKWYRRYCRRLAEKLVAIGCTVFEPPPQACTAEGLLRAEFAEGLTHANHAYGALTARRIEAWLQGLRA
jgi:hypothetical protein